jgi:molybdate transport system substrate-binding protein
MDLQRKRAGDGASTATVATPPTAAADLILLSAGAAKGLVEGIAADFHRTTGVAIRGTFGAVGAMRDKLAAGEACDAFVSTEAILDALAKEGRIVGPSIKPIGRVRTGIAVRSGDPVPNVATSDELAARLREAPAIFMPDPERATAGIHFVRVLDRLGLLAQLGSRLKTYPNGATAMRELAVCGITDAIGCTQVTEILYTPGVVLAGMLPREYELATLYSAAVCTDAKSPELAATFIEWLVDERRSDLRRQGGFENVAA